MQPFIGQMTRDSLIFYFVANDKEYREKCKAKPRDISIFTESSFLELDCNCTHQIVCLPYKSAHVELLLSSDLLLRMIKCH